MDPVAAGRVTDTDLPTGISARAPRVAAETQQRSMALPTRGTTVRTRLQDPAPTEAVPSPTHVRLPQHGCFSDQTGSSLEQGAQSVYFAVMSGDLALSRSSKRRVRRASMADLEQG